MGSPLRVATYNPQQFRSVDLLAVVGTCCTTDLQVERLGRGDRSTSIDLYINTRRFNKKTVRSVESLSGRNKGRAMAMHIKTRIYDITFCAFYLPPGERKKDTDDIIEWVSERVDKCGQMFTSPLLRCQCSRRFLSCSRCGCRKCSHSIRCNRRTQSST